MVALNSVVNTMTLTSLLGPNNITLQMLGNTSFGKSNTAYTNGENLQLNYFFLT
jgi:hypothetical protein